MAKASLDIEISFAWWLQPYLHVLVFFCLLMDTEPNWDKLNVMVKKATKVKVGQITTAD